MSEPIICPDCNHEVSRHGKEGCDAELGDAWVEGLYGGTLMAQGVCGCSAWESEEVTVGLEASDEDSHRQAPRTTLP